MSWPQPLDLREAAVAAVEVAHLSREGQVVPGEAAADVDAVLLLTADHEATAVARALRAATLAPRSYIGRALLERGRRAAACLACGREFDPASGYGSAAHGGRPRSCCSTPCRDRVALERRTTLRGHRTTWHDLAARHATEDAGQLTLIAEPLPPVPRPPPPPTATAQPTLPFPDSEATS